MESQQVEQLKEWQKDHQSFQNFLHIAQTNANRIQSVSTARPTNNPIQYVPQPHHCLPTNIQKSVAYQLSRLQPNLSYDQIPKKLGWINFHYRSWGNLVTYKSFSPGATRVNFLACKPANQVLCQSFIETKTIEKVLIESCTWHDHHGV
jgi:hypothetical protein